MVIKTVYHFVDSNLRVEISQKRGVKSKRGANFGNCSEGVNRRRGGSFGSVLPGRGWCK